MMTCVLLVTPAGQLLEPALVSLAQVEPGPQRRSLSWDVTFLQVYVPSTNSANSLMSRLTNN
jgi:hypothetical protein